MENNTIASTTKTQPTDVRNAPLHLATAGGIGLVIIGVAALQTGGLAIGLMGLGGAIATLASTAHQKKRGNAPLAEGREGGTKVARIAYIVLLLAGLGCALFLRLVHAPSLLGWGLAILFVPSLFAIGVIHQHALLHQED